MVKVYAKAGLKSTCIAIYICSVPGYAGACLSNTIAYTVGGIICIHWTEIILLLHTRSIPNRSCPYT
jgi:hypothetical protein